MYLFIKITDRYLHISNQRLRGRYDKTEVLILNNTYKFPLSIVDLIHFYRFMQQTFEHIGFIFLKKLIKEAISWLFISDKKMSDVTPKYIFLFLFPGAVYH